MDLPILATPLWVSKPRMLALAWEVIVGVDHEVSVDVILKRV